MSLYTRKNLDIFTLFFPCLKKRSEEFVIFQVYGNINIVPISITIIPISTENFM